MKIPSVSLTTTLVCYQARLIWHVNIWLAPLIALLLPVVFFLPDFAQVEERVLWALRIAETFVPFVGILICANLISQEWENHMADLWLTKSFSRGDLLLSRLAVGVGITTLVVLVIIAQLSLTYVPLNLGEALLVTLPPTLFLGMLGMTIGLILRNSAAAFIIPIGYWLFEVTTRGNYTGPFYLFARTACFDPANCVAALTPSATWIFSKLLILGLTVVLVTLAMWLLQRGGRSWQA